MSRTTSAQDFTTQLITAVAAAYGRKHDGHAALGLQPLSELDATHPGRVERELWRQLDEQLGMASARGWQPGELADYLGRAGDAQAQLVRDAITGQHESYSAATVDPRWQAQVDQFEGDGRWAAGRSRLDQLAARHGSARLGALAMTLMVLGALMALPALQPLLPVPGQGASTGTTTRPPAAAEQKVLSRVRGLLAKAEATDFPDEAEALSAKAQALMAKFSLDRAMLDAAGDAAPLDGPAARRVWLESPYVSAKSHLVDAVARANGCRAVTAPSIGFVTILGEEADLQLVELLVTSLLVQANREMLRAGSRRSIRGRSSTRSYRHAFLISYGVRIGERLRATVDEARAAVADERLLPVLARRDEQVDALVTELFPRTVAKQVSVSDGAGWAHGRAAADLARLDTRQRIRSS